MKRQLAAILLGVALLIVNVVPAFAGFGLGG
jgi:hypothetical protein